jgi:putative ABC transport system permease protein
MLASITERVREIGIRMAVGARRRDIFGQILAESTVIGLIGGIIGLALSMSFIRGLETLFPNEVVPILKPSAVLIGFLFAVTVGVIAGLYPAWRASRLHPIEALRYE